MATGITSNSNKRQKSPFYLSYEGKKSKESIIDRSYADFLRIKTIGDPCSNRLFFGDNLDALLFLLHNGYKEKIKLIYIDPPFSTASDFVNRKQERAYSDTLCGAEYIEFLRERLIVMKELLCEDGSIYLHLDFNMAFAMKIIMDEIFGEKNCRAFITRKKCSTKNYTKNTFGNISDYIMFYSKTERRTWNRPFEPWSLEKIIDQYPYVDEQTGRRYKKVPIHAPGIRNGDTGKEWRGMMPPQGKHWQFTPKKLDELDKAGEIYWSPTGNPRRKIFCDTEKGIPIQDIWMNYRDSINQSQQTTGYPTEKNIDMIKMIVGASSNVGDIVLDCFAGSGTTLGAAFELKRNWIGVDNSPESIKAIYKRLVTGLDSYGDYVKKSEFKQTSINLMNRCSFDLYSSLDNQDEISEIISEFESFDL